MELPFHIKNAVRKYEMIETDGIALYPIRVKEYSEFLIGKASIEVMQQSFPVRFMRVPLLTALYQMDYEAASSGKPATGLFFRALLMLALSLRLGDGKGIDERINLFRLSVDRENPLRLRGLYFTDGNGENKEITPVLFSKIRPIIAAQNGVKLESDDANPDLVQAERDLAELNSPNLDASIDHMISFVSALSGAEEAEIDDWPILKLTRRAEALQRPLDYLVCGIGGAFGGFGKGGNPVPHPYYPRVKDTSGALVSMSDFQKSALQGAANGNPT